MTRNKLTENLQLPESCSACEDQFSKDIKPVYHQERVIWKNSTKKYESWDKHKRNARFERTLHSIIHEIGMFIDV